MKQYLAAIVIAGFAILCPPDVEAAQFGFGDDGRVTPIQDVKLKGPQGEALTLAYKTSSKWFLLGLYLRDDGYVLGVKNEPGRYHALSGDQIERWQMSGLLPKPLPAYNIAMIDYVLGYSMWIVAGLVFFGLAGFGWAARSKKKRVDREVRIAVRRTLAKAILSDGSVDRSERIAAQNVYAQLFAENLSPVELARDIAWVSENPVGYDLYIDTMAANLPSDAKIILVQAFTHIIGIDSELHEGERVEFEKFAARVGVDEKDKAGIIAELKKAVKTSPLTSG